MKKEKNGSAEKDLQKLARENQEVLNLLSGYTKHKHVRLVQRGNAAILAALYIVKKINPKPFILIPSTFQSLAPAAPPEHECAQ